MAQGYKDVKERSAVAKFAAKGEENAYYLAWTTTPWTLPSNVAPVSYTHLSSVEICPR